ncbi:hypothetical protein J7E73_06230 [Paenibacillus albidus]|uniref:hypothetical protein n=1 Tax=Paenibacillus albidus TaxID=2041023 RepID=UPI001BEC018C|nr:hypothetical protein [Paenibacillus albidus]MBT2288738.1 hypothetical protein [Paenibacillus albidus]
MSVLAFILEPTDEFEQEFSIPVASESFFNECWGPAIKALQLKWVEHFSWGIDVRKEDLDKVINELLQIREWSLHNLIEAKQEHILYRIDLLITKLPAAFRRENAVVFIG